MPQRLPTFLAKTVRQNISRRILHRMAPSVDASPAEGGLGVSPFANVQPEAWWTALPNDDHTLQSTVMLAFCDPNEAQVRLESWLVADTPGAGAQWTQFDQVACRLIHLAVLHAKLSLPSATAQTLAGSARAHGAWLIRALADAPPSADVAVAHAALIICSLSWPSLPEASNFRGPAQKGLPTSLGQTTGDDGPGTGSPAQLARAAWAVALAKAWSQANNSLLHRDVDGAWLRAVNALWRIGGDAGALPDDPSTCALLPLGTTPLPHTLRNLAVAWGMEAGPPAAVTDLACELLAQDLTGQADSMAAADWRMWSWRASDVSVSHRLIRKKPARVWCSAPQQQLHMSLGDLALLCTAMPQGTLRVARVDGNQATWLYDHGQHTRDIRLRQARVSITDTGLSSVRWELPNSECTPNDKGFEAPIPGGGQLIVKTDPQWRWVIQDGALIGTGPPERVRYSFEIR